MIPAALFFLLMFFVPESPRWLAQEGHDDAATRILAKVGGPQAAEHLVPRLSGFDTVAGHLAWEVLDMLGSDAVPALIRGLKDKDKLTRSSAAQALGKLGPKAASAVPTLRELARHRDQAISRVALAALRKIDSTQISP